MKDKIFAQGYCFPKIFIFFILGCLLGTYYEEILWYIRFGEVTNRDGLIYTPLSPIYGVGVLIFVLLLGRHNESRNLLKTFIYASLIGGMTEYITGFIASNFFGVKFWDYSNYFLNIQGLTTIPFMVFWGIGGTILMKVIYPWLSKWIEKIPYKIGQPIYLVILIVVIVDLFLTYSAFFRMGMRNAGKKPLTFVGDIYDKVYDDEFMYEHFPVMRPNDD